MVKTIRDAIAGIYVVLRNICGIIMLAGLIFTGIRILLSSNIPTKKTQYLMLIQDWLIGMALLIFSHIIMIGIFYISDTLVNALSLSIMGIGGLNANLIAQCIVSFDSAQQLICLIMLGYLIYLTIVFAIAYFKRFLWICVLTVFAPVISIMYAFGPQTKHIYSTWLREYITTVFVQPFHMIVYWVLISIPLNIANSSGKFDLGSNLFEIIYALISLSFIRPAESYIRQLFGMDKGVVGVASFDSGKQTLDAFKKAIEDVVKKIVMVGAVVATGGAAAGVAASEAANAASGISGALGTASETEGIAGVLGEAGGINDVQEAEGVEKNTGKEESMGSSPVLTTTQESSLLDSEVAVPKFDPNNLTPDQRLEKAKLTGQLQRGEISEEDLTNTQKNLLGLNKKEEGLGKEDIIGKSGKSEESARNNRTSKSEEAEELKEAAEKLKEAAETIEGKVGFEEGNGNISEEEASNSLFRRILNKPIGVANLGRDIANGDKSIFDVMSDGYNTKLGKVYKAIGRKIKDTEAFQNLENTNLYQKAKGKVSKGINKAKALEEAGIGKDLYKSFNEIRDTFYVTPPSKDWQRTAGRMDEKSKEKEDQRKWNWVNDKRNQDYIIQQRNYLEKFRDQYPDTSRYSDAYIENLAREKSKADLKTLADTYVPMGIKNVDVAYSLHQDRKKYGYTAEETIYKRAEFEKFNSNTQNITHINNTYNVKASKVSDAVPNAKEYFNRGYTNIADMTNVDAIQRKLNTSLDMATQIDQVLRRGGKVNYSGTDERIKKIFDDLNKNYSKKERK